MYLFSCWVPYSAVEGARRRGFWGSLTTTSLSRRGIHATSNGASYELRSILWILGPCSGWAWASMYRDYIMVSTKVFTWDPRALLAYQQFWPELIRL